MRQRTGWLVLGTVALWAGVAVGQSSAPTLTEVQHLKAQLQQAQEQLLQTQYQLAQCNAQVQIQKLNDGRAALEKELQRPGYVFDWTTLTYKPSETKPIP